MILSCDYLSEELRLKIKIARSHIILEKFSKMDETQFNDAISEFTQSQTREFLEHISEDDKVKYAELIDRIKTARIIDTSFGFLGGMQWRGGSSADPILDYQIRTTTSWGRENHFAKWLRGIGPEPKDTNTMNCWEGILFLVFKAGVVSKNYLVSIHRQATDAALEMESRGGSVNQCKRAYYDTLQRRIYIGARIRIHAQDPISEERPYPDIPRGYLIFLNGMNHVVLSMGSKDENGETEVMSLWVNPLPGCPGECSGTEKGFFQLTTLEELIFTGEFDVRTLKIEYAKPAW